jgi:hypothetical protein
MTEVEVNEQEQNGPVAVGEELRTVLEKHRDKWLLERSVPVEKMFVAEYGRQLSEQKVLRMQRHWNPRAVGVLQLSMRNDGTFAILDGHHRKVAAEREGVHGLPARVYIDLSYEEEAELYTLFATVNRQSAIDLFRARVEANDPVANDLRRLLQVRDADIALRGPGLNLVQSPTTLERIYRQQGREFTAQIIDLIADAWNKQPRAWIATNLGGMTAFWARYRKNAKHERVIQTMKLTGPERLLAIANEFRTTRQTGQPFEAWAKGLRREYNTGLRTNKLPDWSERDRPADGLPA